MQVISHNYQRVNIPDSGDLTGSIIRRHGALPTGFSLGRLQTSVGLSIAQFGTHETTFRKAYIIVKDLALQGYK